MDETRARIVATAARLLAERGRDGLTTRAVAAAAGVQAPAIYRLLRDKRGLEEAVAEYAWSTYLSGKTGREPIADPVAELRASWDLHVDFGLANPELYVLMYGDPGTTGRSAATAAGAEVLGGTVHRIAAAGRLRVPEPLAVDLVRASGHGVVLTLLTVPADRRDPAFAPTAREAMIAAIVKDAPVIDEPGPAAAAVALKALLPEATTLTEPERLLLGEWLDRLSTPAPPGP
jgi:AcrR family transcriptional regulator